MADERKSSAARIIRNGVLDENPTFRLALGMCPTLAVTTAAINGLGMGAATTFVLAMSNLFISLLRKQIPENIRIPAFVVIIASFTTIVQMLIKAFVPALDAALGIFIPLIVVNCIVFARAEAFAFKNTAKDSTLDGLGMGIGFTCALTILSSVREAFGSGTWFGIRIMPEGFQPMAILTQPPGGFLTLGIVLALFNAFEKRYLRKPSAIGKGAGRRAA
ncbi:MAG: electron transport complex subunit E [Oscillospiraceae bacterium]|jgi:electron transport complex protein RnfE|nr:electron transport complex subunit E [Oscillospiraceae bacterium]